jgi:hypothetical protein
MTRFHGLGQEVGGVTALNILQSDEVLSVADPHIENSDDIRMTQSGQRPTFVEEPLHKPGLVRKLGKEFLYDDWFLKSFDSNRLSQKYF